MRLPRLLPRLNRRQKILRNFLAAVLLVFLAWAVNDFRAPTANLALRWRAEEYGLSAPEVLYRSTWEGDQRDVVFRTEGFYGTARETRYSWLEYTESSFLLVEPEGPVVFLQESRGMDPEAVYVCADLPDDAGAVCALRLRDVVNGSEFDETYTMEAAPDANGVYRFPLERKYTDGVRQEKAERLELSLLASRIRSGPKVDFNCDVTVTFYDEQGEVVHTYEEVLAEASAYTK